jgi:D-galactarolactone cycloisomerase
MKITAVRSRILEAPMEHVVGNSQVWVERRTAHLVFVETDEGIVGVGEAFGPGSIAGANAAILKEVLGPRVIGLNPMDREVIWQSLYNATRESGQKGAILQAMSGLDIALWDIAGKFHELPLYRLLGGAFRDRIEPYAFGLLWPREGDRKRALAKEAEHLVGAGFKAMKMKIGISPREDLEMVKAVRSSIGDDIELFVDANHAYTSTVALPLGRRLEEEHVGWLEEPVPGEDLDGYLELKTALDLPIAGGEAEYTRWGFRELLSRRCVDIVQPDVSSLGGITEYLKVVALASTWHVPVVPHVWGSCIAISLNLNLLAALPDLPGSLTPVQARLELDTTPNPMREQLAKDWMNPLEEVARFGSLPRPESPGLGVTLDEDAIRRFEIR